MSFFTINIMSNKPVNKKMMVEIYMGTKYAKDHSCI